MQACDWSVGSRTGPAPAGTGAGALQPGGNGPHDDRGGDPPSNRRIQCGYTPPKADVAALPLDRPSALLLPTRDFLQHLAAVGVFAALEHQRKGKTARRSGGHGLPLFGSHRANLKAGDR